MIFTGKIGQFIESSGYFKEFICYSVDFIVILCQL